MTRLLHQAACEDWNRSEYIPGSNITCPENVEVGSVKVFLDHNIRFSYLNPIKIPSKVPKSYMICGP